MLKDRFGNEVRVGSKVALASRAGSCGAELKIRMIEAVDFEKGIAFYRTPNGRRERLISDANRWVVLGGAGS